MHWRFLWHFICLCNFHLDKGGKISNKKGYWKLENKKVQLKSIQYKNCTAITKTKPNIDVGFSEKVNLNKKIV